MEEKEVNFYFNQCIFLQVNFFTEIDQGSQTANIQTEIWEILVLLQMKRTFVLQPYFFEAKEHGEMLVWHTSNIHIFTLALSLHWRRQRKII